MLGADEADAHAFGLQGGGAENVAALGGEGSAAVVARIARREGVEERVAERFQLDPGVAQGAGGSGLGGLQDGEQDVAGANGVVAQAGGFELGVLDDAAAAAGEAAEVLDRGVFVGFAVHGPSDSSEADGDLVDEVLQTFADAVAEGGEHDDQDDDEDGGDEDVAEDADAGTVGQVAAPRMAGRSGGVEVGRHTGSGAWGDDASVDGRQMGRNGTGSCA